MKKLSNEQFLRLELMIGEEGLKHLHEATVVVAGIGAVGSYATEALVRAGVGTLRLVDFDEVRPSNINRQLIALHSTVGLRKVDIAAARMKDINPSCNVEVMPLFIDETTIDEVLSGEISLVIDAIDSFSPKVSFLAELIERKIPTISSMGAALRTDPTRINAGRLEDVTVCPLARRLRKFLRRRGLPLDTWCVYSNEPVNLSYMQEPEDSDVFDRGRPRRTLGSLPTLTGIFGLFIANEALKMLLGDCFPASQDK